VGSDSVGDLITRELRGEGVDVHAIVDADAQTGLMIKSRPWGDISRVEYFRSGSAGSRLSPEDVDEALVRSAGVLHVSGITPALSQSASDAIDRAVDIATEAGVPVSFDINYRSRLWSRERASAACLRLARRATILFAGEDEAELLVPGTTPEEYARALGDLGPGQVLVKLGARGALASIAGELHTAAAIPIVPVDTVGAGDAFAAGYLAELLAGADVPTRLATASRAGAFACLAPGDWEGFPRRSDLDILGSSDPVMR
jgi:2-dehydro-3-deoxygluconokinase